MATQQRGRSPSGGQRGQGIGPAASTYPYQGPVAGPGFGIAHRHSSGTVPHAISTHSSPSAQMSQFMPAGPPNPGVLGEQQMSPASSQGHISPTHGSISPRSRSQLGMAFPSNPVDQGQALQGMPGDYNFPRPGPELNQQQALDAAVFMDAALRSNAQAAGQGINPTDLMGQVPSPFQAGVAASEAPRMDRDASSRSFSPHTLDPLGFAPTQHSPRDSLTPASAAFAQGQPIPDWTSMMQTAAFQGHRRAPSEQSDMSSAAPSPYLGNADGFDPIDQQRSPLLRSQPDGLYPDALGIEQFNISDPPPAQRFSPGPSPSVSPRLSPHADMNLGHGGGHGGGFGLPPNAGDSQFPALAQADMYAGIKSERIPSLQLNNGAGEFGMAAPMDTPQIQIHHAAPLRQPALEPPQPMDDSNTLNLPERGRKARLRAHSDPYTGGSPVQRSPSPRAPLAFEARRSLSPHSSVVVVGGGGGGGGGGSASSSPKSSRRSSTSSIPNRDYILDLADPQRPGSGAAESKRIQKHPATFQCSLCPKRFTRAYNLRSHLRTHTDERPFVCTVCGKAFARQHDRKRHEGLHSGEKKFVCKGDLKSGGAWGCGRRFARADALGRHFRSEAGRVCIKPLLDEEAAQRQQLQQQQQLHAAAAAAAAATEHGQLLGHHQQPHDPHAGLGGLGNEGVGIGLPNLGNGGDDVGGGGAGGGAAAFPVGLPQALLVQYPALANIQWDRLGPPGPEDGGGAGGAGGAVGGTGDLVGHRGSFDAGASSGGDFYDDDPDASGYVSGPGTDYGAGPPSLESWVSDGYLSDYGGTGR